MTTANTKAAMRSNPRFKLTKPETLGIMPKNNLGKTKAAVCPECGYVEIYLSRLDKIQQYNR